MNDFNFLGFEKAEVEKPIFRVCTYERLVEILREKTLTLVKPKLWDDPFENFLLRARFRLKTGNVIKLDAHDRLYAQCWSRTKESDAMWRIYAPKKDGIKLRTTARKLGNALWKSCHHNPERSCFIGKVRYLSRLKVTDNLAKELCVSRVISDQTGREHARSLLIKRWAFHHENEVRLIYYDRTKANEQNLLPFKCDPVHLIDEIIFDPRMPIETYKVKRDEVLTHGFPGQRVKRSGLYEFPNLVFDV